MPRSNLPNALRAAARAILDEAGPDVVGLRETACRVGVSATAAYRHFTDQRGSSCVGRRGRVQRARRGDGDGRNPGRSARQSPGTVFARSG